MIKNPDLKCGVQMVQLGLSLIPTYSTDKLIRQAKMAESQGFDYIWVADNYWSYNPYVILTAMAIHTKKVKLGPSITSLFGINPAYISTLVAALNSVSDGRAVLGIGPGDLSSLMAIGESRKKPLTQVACLISFTHE